MKDRSVKQLLYAYEVDMGGVPVRQPFPTQRVEQIDPFILLHHVNIKVPSTHEPRHSGVGPHPHRGFSPVTFILQGGVHHRDSRGNNSVIYAGGAQWMNAGMGIIHSERPPQDIHTIGGRQEIIQLWINTPAKNKMDQPVYYPLPADEVPKKTSDDGLITLNLFSGELFDIKGPISAQAKVIAATMEIKKDGKISIPLPKTHNAIIYLVDGKLNIGGFGMVEELHAVHFNKDGDSITIEGFENTRALLLSGEPLDEKLVKQGPFVMNTETQILEAMRDYQKGKMGVLIED